MKDLFDFKPGWPATFGGVRALRDSASPTHCTYAERMEAAGAILVGKTNSPVMGFRGTCDNYLFGPTPQSVRPRQEHRRLLGRQRGRGGRRAAAAAEATDGGGSIRIPASWCGLYGFKASFGRVPSSARPNAFGGINPFLFEGASRARSTTRRSRWTCWPATTSATRSPSTSRSISPAARAGRSRAGGSPTAPTSASSRSTPGSRRWSSGRSRPSRRPGAVVEEVTLGIASTTSASSATCGAG